MAPVHRSFVSLGPLKPLMDKCVHCGFCLSTCPSYLLLGQETDSPRGRIYLMRAGLEGRIDVTPSLVQHFDTCLGCMACETACPSGVRYAPLLEDTRAIIERHHDRGILDRLFRQLLLAIVPYPARLRAISWPLPAVGFLRRFPRLLSMLPARLRGLIAVAPSGGLSRRQPPPLTPAAGVRRLSVGLLTGCVQRVFFADVNDATVRLLAAEGCDVIAPPSQGCCGALALHAGGDAAAKDFARALIQTFEGSGADQIVVNAAGCGSTMKSYGELLAGDPAWAERARAFAGKVRDVTETLSGLVPFRAARHAVDLRVAYHDACHLAHAQSIRQEPRELLQSIPGLTVVPIAESDICCGSAGIFNLVQPEMAATLGQRKAGRIADSGADIVVTSNPGCSLQIAAARRAAGTGRPVLHIIELLDASVRGVPVVDGSS